jgi:hypothetical protein
LVAHLSHLKCLQNIPYPGLGVWIFGIVIQLAFVDGVSDVWGVQGDFDVQGYAGIKILMGF